MLNWPPKKALFDFKCHLCCVSWWKLDLFKVKIDVCKWYNRISAYRPFAYCIPSKKNWILRTKRGWGYHPLKLGILSLCTESWHSTRSISISWDFCLYWKAIWWIYYVDRYWLWIHTHLSTTLNLTFNLVTNPYTC